MLDFGPLLFNPFTSDTRQMFCEVQNVYQISHSRLLLFKCAHYFFAFYPSGDVSFSVSIGYSRSYHVVSRFRLATRLYARHHDHDSEVL